MFNRYIIRSHKSIIKYSNRSRLFSATIKEKKNKDNDKDNDNDNDNKSIDYLNVLPNLARAERAVGRRIKTR